MTDQLVVALKLYQSASDRAQAARDQVGEVAWCLLAGEGFQLFGRRCSATLTWPDGPPMPEDELRELAVRSLAELRERRSAT